MADELRGTGRVGGLRIWTSALLRHIGRYQGLAASVARAVGDDPLAVRCGAADRSLAELVDHAREQGEVRGGVTAADVSRLATAVAWAAEAAGEPDGGERLMDLVFAGLTNPDIG